MPLSQSEYQDRRQLIRDAVSSQLGRFWASMGSYRDADVDRFVRVAVPKVKAGQLATARVTAQYLGGSVDRQAVMSARNADPAVVYRRPAVTVYTALAQGAGFVQAVAEGAARLDSLLATDMQLAHTTQARSSMSQGGYEYYRRVLSGSENCARCAIASTQRYHVRDLMPIHPGCDCGVETVNADFDPGQVIDPDYLEQVHIEVERFTGFSDRGARDPDYRDLIVTHEHGEYGPTLAWRRDHFTGPADLPAVLDTAV